MELTRAVAFLAGLLLAAILALLIGGIVVSTDAERTAVEVADGYEQELSRCQWTLFLSLEEELSCLRKLEGCNRQPVSW